MHDAVLLMLGRCERMTCSGHTHFEIPVIDEVLDIPIDMLFQYCFSDSPIFRKFLEVRRTFGKSTCHIFLGSYFLCQLLHFFQFSTALIRTFPNVKIVAFIWFIQCTGCVYVCRADVILFSLAVSVSVMQMLFCLHGRMRLTPVEWKFATSRTHCRWQTPWVLKLLRLQNVRSL